MERMKDSDFFSDGAQGDLFGPPPRVSYAPKPEKVRQKMLAMLGQIGARRSVPGAITSWG